MPRIVIDGNIGSGKTFYLKRLEKDGYIVHHEDVKKWSNWLQKYNTDMKRYALGFQLQILHDQARLPYKKDQVNIYERSPYTLKNVFGDLLYEEGLFDTDEYELHNRYVKDFAWSPDVIIYLFCDPLVCQERVKSRFSISGDDQLTGDYLKKLHLKHETVFDDLNCHIPLYKINSQEDPETVYKNIKDIISKIEKTC